MIGANLFQGDVSRLETENKYLKEDREKQQKQKKQQQQQKHQQQQQTKATFKYKVSSASAQNTKIKTGGEFSFGAATAPKETGAPTFGSPSLFSSAPQTAASCFEATEPSPFTSGSPSQFGSSSSHTAASLGGVAAPPKKHVAPTSGPPSLFGSSSSQTAASLRCVAAPPKDAVAPKFASPSPFGSSSPQTAAFLGGVAAPPKDVVALKCGSPSLFGSFSPQTAVSLGGVAAPPKDVVAPKFASPFSFGSSSSQTAAFLSGVAPLPKDAVAPKFASPSPFGSSSPQTAAFLGGVAAPSKDVVALKCGSPSLFGSSSPQTAVSLGGVAAPPKDVVVPKFASPSAFGSSSSQTAAFLSGVAPPPEDAVVPTFGSASLFGSSQTAASFGGVAPPKESGVPTLGSPSVFGSSASQTGKPFESKTANNDTTTFASVAKAADKSTTKKQEGFSAFDNEGKTLFDSTTGGGRQSSPGKSFVKSPVKDSDDDHEPGEYEPDVEFMPIVELPEVVDLRTSEEDEEKLFGARSKLFRHDAETKQWKERGVGEIKILRHRETAKCRILMRREQVLKLCANHVISKDMKLLPLSSSNNAWCWLAPDYSEEEMKHEHLAAKFKNDEVANEFKSVFEKCIEDIGKTDQAKTDSPSKPASDSILLGLIKRGEGSWTCEKCKATNVSDTDQCVSCSTRKQTSTATKPGNQSLATKFAIKPGEWDCSACLIRNTAGDTKCKCCETLKPVDKAQSPEVPSTRAAKLATQIPVVTGKGSLASKFVIKEGEWECSACLVRNYASDTKCTCCETAKPAEKVASPKATAAAKLATQTPVSKNSLAEQFRMKTGQWECDTCLVKNNEDSVFCVSCETPKPGANVQSQTVSSSSTPSAAAQNIKIQTGGGFSFGGATAPKAGAPSFGSPSLFGSAPSQPGVSFGGVTAPPKDAVAPTFGSPSLFGSSQTAPSFGDLAAPKESGVPTFGSSSNFGSAASQTVKPFKPPASFQSPSSGGFRFDPVTSATDASTKPDSTTTAPAAEPDKPSFSLKKPGFNFGAAESNTVPESKPSFSFGSEKPVADEAPVGGSFTFGNAPVSQPSGFSFSVSDKAQDLSITAKPNVLTPKNDKDAGDKFGLRQFVFSGLTPTKSPVKTPQSPQSPEYYINQEGEEPDIYFEPIVTLPEKVDVRTGEEDEQVLFSNRAKLYRHIDNEWRDRGVGEVKILHNQTSSTFRVLMRREQVRSYYDALCFSFEISP